MKDKTEDERKESFLNFVSFWNEYQNISIPLFHKKIINFLDNCFDKNITKVSLMAFRNSGKSTLVGLYSAWLLYYNSNLRIIVISAESNLARKMVRNVKRIIEQHEWTKFLKPKKTEQWGANCFTVNRNIESRDPSMQAYGLNGNITGSRADVIICDDVEVPNNCNNKMKRLSLREKLSELDYVLVPKGMQIYIGTPHTYYSIYSKEIFPEMEIFIPFLDGFLRYEQPLILKNGESSWPERFTAEDIDEIKKRQGHNKFMSQMQLICFSPKEYRLKVQNIKKYSDDIKIIESNNKLTFLLEKKIMQSYSCVWDPSYGSLKGDKSIVALVLNDKEGRYYFHDMLNLKTNNNEKEDCATQQCLEVIDFLKKYRIHNIYIETNGIGKFLPSLLRKKMTESNYFFKVKEIISKTNKQTRILNAFDAVLDSEYFFISKNIESTEFMLELREFKPESKNNEDDIIDAVAYCLTEKQSLFNKFNCNKNHKYNKKKIFYIKDDFDF